MISYTKRNGKLFGFFFSFWLFFHVSFFLFCFVLFVLSEVEFTEAGH